MKPTKKKKKKKQPTLTYYKKKLWELFSIFIRVRDCLQTTGCSSWGLCISCNRRYHYKLLQAGHFLPGRHGYNLYSEKGTHSQCYNCNVNLRGNTMEYQDALIKMYGQETIDELRRVEKITKQYKIYEIQEMIEEYKKKIKAFGILPPSVKMELLKEIKINKEIT